MSAQRKMYQLNDSPKTLINGFKDSAVIGNLLFQWGQDVSVSDADQTFSFKDKFSGKVHTVLTTISYKNVKSCLAIGGWTQSAFTINRHNDINGNMPFCWVAIGEAPAGTGEDDRPSSYRILENYENVKLVWGKSTSTSDGTQNFELSSSLDNELAAIFTTAAGANFRWNLSISDLDAANKRFSINRGNSINGGLPFQYLALGYTAGKKASSPGLLFSDEENGLLLQWGKATSTSDYEQAFSLHSSFADTNFSVITTFSSANMPYGLSLTRPVNNRSFIIDRDGDIDGNRDFFWMAVGRRPKTN